MAIVRIQLRRDTAADWTSANPVLAEGEMGIETDTDQFKIGDGATAWNSLGYGGLAGADGLPGIVASDVAPVDTDVIWLDTDDPLEPLVVPGGGTTGQVLSKASGDDYDTEWTTPSYVPVVGPADTVLTSNGTTAVWADAAGGGAQALVKFPYEVYAFHDVDFPANSVVRFAVVTTSPASFVFNLLDSSDNLIESISVDRDNPFTYFTNATAVAKISSYQDIIDETVQLYFSVPTSAEEPDAVKDVIAITSTQSVTLTKTYDAFIVGGGGGGGNCNQRGSAGGGGGGGYLATGTITAGTYTATVGAGGGTTASGGTTSIDTLSANGGSGGASGSSSSDYVGGDGGDGGSAGGGGAGNGGSVAEGGLGGVDGGNGDNGAGGGTPGSGGTGSGTQASTTLAGEFKAIPPRAASLEAAGFYAGGSGGKTQEPALSGEDASDFGGGGGGATANSAVDRTASGGSGGSGYIFLVEA